MVGLYCLLDRYCHICLFVCLSVCIYCVRYVLSAANDCFQLASVSYANQDYYHTYMWVTEAMRLYETEDVKTVDLPTLLDHAAYSLYMVKT